MADTTQTRWFHLTPGRFVIGLLVVEGLVWLSDKFGWLGWHKGYAVLTGVAVVGVAMLVWFAAATIFRRRFQLSPQMQMVRLAVVAVPFCWLAAEMKKAGDQLEAVLVIEKLGGNVEYDWEVDADGRKGALATPPGQKWLRNLLGVLGINFFAEVDRVTIVSNEYSGHALVMLTRFSQLKELCVAGHQVTDATLEDLTGMRQLRRLTITDTLVTDAGVAKLQKALPNCKITR